MLLTDFKNTVDSYSATLLSDNLGEAYEKLKMDGSGGHAARAVTDMLYEKINQALACSNGLPDKLRKTKVFGLQEVLVYRYVLYGENPVEYLQALKVIQDSCRQTGNYFPPFSATAQWQEAIVNSKNYIKFSPRTHGVTITNLRNEYAKAYDIATSVKQLHEKGCEIEITDDGVFVKSGLESVVLELSQKIKEIGGLVVIRSLFNHLQGSNQYSTRFERYFITRTASGISIDQKPQIPIGFLLNLALKYPYEKSENKNAQKTLDEITHLAIVISNGAYGVQQYNSWEFHFQSGETIVQFCSDIALWDSMFSIPQCRPSLAVEICNKLFSFITDTDFLTATGFLRSEFVDVVKVITELPADSGLPFIIYSSRINKAIKHIEKTSIQKILDFISHNGAINKDYALPADYSSIDFGTKPLVKLGPTKFLLTSSSWCAPNYFESLAGPLREHLKKNKQDLDNALGRHLEEFLQGKFTGAGIHFLSGDYREGAVAGECDFLIEGSSAIILIEFKKKVLTRKSKSGIDTNIMLDLSASILSAQLQAGRTEIILRERGSVTIATKTGEVKVNLNGRKIERVALTQLEFGGFQDRGVIQQFFRALLTHSFGTFSEEPGIIKKFKQLEEKRQRWVEQYNKLCDLDPGFAHFPFFNCWFVSLPQLMEIINLSDDTDSFCKAFVLTKHLTANTLDWYKEFDLATGMKKSHQLEKT